MIGQNNLISKINLFNINTLPHSMLLIGEYGSEKYDICEYISRKFNLPLFDITELISEDYINEIYSMPDFGLYIIDGTKISEREQNILLKFYEEPNAYTYIILIVESKYNILETIQTRSYELIMDIYSKELLSQLCDEEKRASILQIATTPGMVEELNHVDLTSLKLLCNNIVDKISIAGYQNTLTISEKINFKDEYEKFPLWAFIRMLGNTMLEKHSDLYWLLQDFNKKYKPLLNKKHFFENLLTRMWLEAHNGH